MSEMPEPIEGYHGCEWPVDPACLGDTWAALDPDIQERSQALAGETLRRLTGYRVGGCPVTVRPCNVACYTGYGYGGWLDRGWGPINLGGRWVNTCSCASACGCSAPSLRLPAPVGEVYEVLIDGDAFTDYLVSGDSLIRTDGEQWPTTQDLTLADTEVGTWAVTYLNSYPVDALGAYAAGVLAVEFSKACTTGKCRLPNTVTSVARQGVTFEIPLGAFPGGVTGIKEVDAYISLWNPNHIRQAPGIYYPGSAGEVVIR